MSKEDPVEEGRGDEGGPPDSQGDGTGDVWEFLDLRDLVNDPKAVTWDGASGDENPAADPGRSWDFLNPRDLDKENRVVTWNGESGDETPAADPGRNWDFLDHRDLVKGVLPATWKGPSGDEVHAGDQGLVLDFLDRRNPAREVPPVSWNGAPSGGKPAGGAGPSQEKSLSIGNGGRAVTWDGDLTGAHRNGAVPGRGVATGKSLVGGKGLINGNGLVNGNSFAIGAGKGLSGGSGLVNGNGLVNGCERPTDDSPFQARQAPGWRNAAAGKRLRLALLAAIAAGLVMGVPLIAMLALPPDDGMAVDGDLSDWAGTTVLSDGVDGRVGSPDQDIVRYATAVSGNDVLFLVKVAGTMLAGKGEAVDFVNAFIDADSDSSTGYSIRGMGADNRLEVWGFGGQSRGCTFYGFSPARGNADWNGWNTLGSGKASAVQGGLELSAWKNGFLTLKAGSYRVLFQTSRSHGGARDFSEMMTGPSGPGLLVSQVPVEEPALAIKPGPQPVLRLALEARGGTARLSELVLERSGNASAGAVGEVQLRSGERVLSSGRFVSGRLALKVDVPVSPGRIVKLDLLVSILDGAEPGSVFGLGLAGQDSARLRRGTATVLGAGVRSFYIGAPPARISIDGAFGDWNRTTAHPDATGEAGNPSTDLVDGRAEKEAGTISFLARVDGTMLGGEAIPLPFEDRPLPVPAGPPGPPGGIVMKNVLVPQDTVAAYIDADASNASGFSLPGTEIGAEYLLVVTGAAGRITGRQAYSWSPLNKSWDRTGTFEAARDPDRLELQAPLRPLGIALGPLFRVQLFATDWSGSRDALDNPITLKDPLLMSDNSTIHSSGDSMTWKLETTIVDNLNARDLCTDSNGYVYALDYSGDVYKSTGNWAQWSRIINSALFRSVAIATDGTYFYAMETDGDTYKASSGGSWSKQGDVGASSDYEDMCIDSSGNLYAVRSNTCSTAFNSTDGGQNWNAFGDKNVGNAGGTETNIAIVYGTGWSSTNYLFILQSDGRIRYDTDGKSIDPWNATSIPGNSTGQVFSDIDYHKTAKELWIVVNAGKVYNFTFGDTAPSGTWNTTLGNSSDVNPIIAIAVNLVPEFRDVLLPLGGLIAIVVAIRSRARKHRSR